MSTWFRLIPDDGDREWQLAATITEVTQTHGTPPDEVTVVPMFYDDNGDLTLEPSTVRSQFATVRLEWVDD